MRGRGAGTGDRERRAPRPVRGNTEKELGHERAAVTSRAAAQGLPGAMRSARSRRAHTVCPDPARTDPAHPSAARGPPCPASEREGGGGKRWDEYVLQRWAGLKLRSPAPILLLFCLWTKMLSKLIRSRVIASLRKPASLALLQVSSSRGEGGPGVGSAWATQGF